MYFVHHLADVWLDNDCFLLCLLAAGLDARAAAIVMHSVKAVAAAGHTVMVTIHQPSIQIFEAFDTLLLLQVGLSCFAAGLGIRIAVWLLAVSSGMLPPLPE
eukprot:GHUV01048856.1.p1 GENE.GHUV01048856.1~~GHUV01048856.1.p1  ORF type:complete len:102 (+),score=23.59 GHUV01048856.1:557-862(+)